jgi:LacI family transcriptional regulator
MSAGATLKNIAKVLNISISTVSRALKNHPDISDETKRKVTETASMLEYEPNAYAISLRTNKSRLIGIIIPYISYYFYHSFITAAEEEAKKNNYSLLILQSGDSTESELENLKVCRINKVAAVFISISPHTKDIKPFLRLTEDNTPVIFFDRVPDYEACDKVRINDEEAATLAANKIISSGYKKVLAIFGNPELSITRKREQTFNKILGDKLLPKNLTEVNAVSSKEAELETTKALKSKNKPEVIFCMSDEVLTGVMKSIQKSKLSIPEDVAVVSISNDSFIPSLYEPEITYIETSGYELGKLAFKRMLDYIGGKTFIQEVLLPPKLMEGKSL